MSCKLAFKWLGPYQICNLIKDKSIYILEKLDRSQLAGIFTGDKLKKFHLRQQLQLYYIPYLVHEEIPTLNDFFAGNNNSDLPDAPDDFGF